MAATETKSVVQCRHSVGGVQGQVQFSQSVESIEFSPSVLVAQAQTRTFNDPMVATTE